MNIEIKKIDIKPLDLPYLHLIGLISEDIIKLDKNNISKINIFLSNKEKFGLAIVKITHLIYPNQKLTFKNIIKNYIKKYYDKNNCTHS